MLAKRHGDWIEGQSEAAATFNQIWGKMINRKVYIATLTFAQHSLSSLTL